MPKGSRHVPLDSWMASRKSAAVSSSHFTESLDCARMEHTVIIDTKRKQIAARFMDIPPEPPCILALKPVIRKSRSTTIRTRGAGTCRLGTRASQSDRGPKEATEMTQMAGVAPGKVHGLEYAT